MRHKSVKVSLFGVTVDLLGELPSETDRVSYVVYRLAEGSSYDSSSLAKCVSRCKSLGYIGSIRDYILLTHTIFSLDLIESDPLYYASSADVLVSEYARSLI